MSVEVAQMNAADRLTVAIRRIGGLCDALRPLARAARTEADLARYRAKNSTFDAARALIELAEQWEKLHDDAEAAINTALGKD